MKIQIVADRFDREYGQTWKVYVDFEKTGSRYIYSEIFKRRKPFPHEVGMLWEKNRMMWKRIENQDL